MSSSRGNALFLILIAVALFAALSYAVTQSGRGSGTVDKEKIILTAAQLVQYSSFLRDGTTRMVIMNPNATYYFNTPGTPGYNNVSRQPTQLHHPSGGNTPYRNIATDLAALCTSSPCATAAIDSAGVDAFSGVGTSAGDYVFWFGPVTQTACTEINTKLGLAGTAQEDTDYASPMTYDSYPGEAVFCYRTSVADGGEYWYGHVIKEF